MEQRSPVRPLLEDALGGFLAQAIHTLAMLLGDPLVLPGHQLLQHESGRLFKMALLAAEGGQPSPTDRTCRALPEAAEGASADRPPLRHVLLAIRP